MEEVINQSDRINWLLEDSNPAVKYRTQTELLGLAGDRGKVADWLIDRLPANWPEAKGLWFNYYITAFAECGLSFEDLPGEAIEKAFALFDENIDCGCGEFMLLTALMKLGLQNHPAMERITAALPGRSLPDGGFVCQRIVNKLDHVPKSCYKADIHALFFVAECRKKGLSVKKFQALIDYFLGRNLFYKSGDRTALVIDAQEGWRSIDAFYPFEPMRAGIQNIVEAFCALGYGDDRRLQEAWRFLEKNQDEAGRVILKGTLTKSYLPKTKEKVGMPSKWATFYALLAQCEKLREINPCL